MPTADHHVVDGDPFTPGALPPNAKTHIVSLTKLVPADRKVDPFEPERHVCRDPEGQLWLIDIGAHGSQAIGAPTTFADAGEFAAAILAGDQRALTVPGVTRILALAYIAALATAEKRRLAAQAAYADASGSPARTAPDPSARSLNTPNRVDAAGADASALPAQAPASGGLLL